MTCVCIAIDTSMQLYYARVVPWHVVGESQLALPLSNNMDRNGVEQAECYELDCAGVGPDGGDVHGCARELPDRCERAGIDAGETPALPVAFDASAF